jgi:aspartate-semialdehyde dehydrogenase
MSGARVAVVGATGALGSEVARRLDEAGPWAGALMPVATERSLGAEVGFRDQAVAVETEAGCLRGADLVLLCAPPEASLGWARAALRLGVPALDCSGALALREEVPLALDAWAADPSGGPAPVVALPPGGALAWIRVLAPLHGELGLRRVVATALASAASSGLPGVEALQAETVALLGQAEAPESPLDHPLAFDVLPWAGEVEEEGTSGVERELAALVHRALGAGLGVTVTVARVPTFCGDAASLALEAARPTTPLRVRELLRKAPEVELVDDPRGPTTRAAAGRDRVLVGRVRPDPSRPEGVLLWLAADSLCLAAAHAVRLAETRLATT